MSDSRLEKFIYAICSMDVSDLPVPLSRIEKLWNCLITGETPDFEPLSRNEKYLMAMLDRYDISNLPAPMSRGEKLLYKIAVGETDLSDVPGYLSRYEELLKYLIENGGISGGDFEYVLHMLNQSLSTLYTTAEKPVKSAILKGQTLVNLVNDVTSNEVGSYTDSPCRINVIRNLQNETLTIIFNVISLEIPDGADGTLRIGEGWNGQIRCKPTLGVNKVLYNCNQTSKSWLGVFINTKAYNLGQRITISDVMVLEGDYTNVDIPYFEGMQSVKMPVLSTVGKNLLNINGLRQENAYIDHSDGQVKKSNGHMAFLDYIRIPSDKNITFFNNTVDSGVYLKISFYDGDKQFISGNSLNTGSLRVVSPSNAKYCRVSGFYHPNDFDLQLEVGGRSSYEPFKSNILSTNEDVVLRGIGDVQDELNLLTGEVTQRISNTMSLDETNFVIERATTLDNSTSKRYIFKPKNEKIKMGGVVTSSVFSSTGNTKLVTNALISRLELLQDINNTDWDDVKTLNEYLISKNAQVEYELETESIKTVDLTTVDQDNQPTQLGTFENITHVSLESAGLIPEVEMEVATRISKELASASPLMDDISMKQEQLNTTVDEQSNNVDATMIATTEIYEEIL